MPTQHFTHLHLHSDFSLLDGAISLDKLIQYGIDHKRKALAISDHGNIFGAVKFFTKCKKAGIKPVLGMEAYITDSVAMKNIQNRYYHLLILVQNQVGYKNLCRLIEFSYKKGFYYKPRIDYQVLKKYHEGLIITSTCIGGHIPQLILNNQFQEVEEVLEGLMETFGDRYFLEVQPPYLNDQKIVNNHIFELEKKYGIPVLLTGDCHYVSREDRYAHEVMLAVQTRTTMADPDRMNFGDCQAHMQHEDELISYFPGREDILWTSGCIADSCEFEFVTGKLFFPQYALPSEYKTSEAYFRALSWQGFEYLVQKKKIPSEKIDLYKDRLHMEIDMIASMGFASYLLIVSDFILWAKKNGIAVGPGRGSVVGSLVAWALSITDLDPIRYNLFFERFLNPERVSMPDIDVDFCFHGRERVINYVKQAYGEDRVGQIITFGTMMSKGVLKDVARALGFSFEDANMITGLVPDELKISLQDAVAQEPKLQKLIQENKKIEELFDIASRLEGLTRHASKHAAGIVISPEPIAEVLPIYIPPKSNDVVTQYAMTELEVLGFLKIDFLGLKNLTLITNIITLVKKNYGIVIDILDIPLDDEKAFSLLRAGNTAGVFQFESNGIKDVLRKLQPTTFEEIIAVNALYRPGPLGSGMVDDFIERKHGRQEINYFFDELESILKETYGVIVYQEQVMQIASKLAGYSLGESDLLRRAMGKKKAEEMEKQKSIFMVRAVERGFDKKKIEEVFDVMAYFAGYGFNKAHSAAYGLIAYQTAYLKSHYPVEFMASLITLELSHPDSTIEYIQNVKESNIVLLPPDINVSSPEFIPENNAIRWGLLGIKNVGEIAVSDIIAQREKYGKYHNLLDLCYRIDLRTSNKRVLESLIVSGALDCFPHSRAQMLVNLEEVMAKASWLQEKKKSLQLGLFETEQQSSISVITELELPPSQEHTIQQRLEAEKEVLGLYLSHHPIDSFLWIKRLIGATSIAEVAPVQNQKILVSVLSCKEIKTKKNDLMAFVTVEDQNKKCELIFFPRVYLEYKDKLQSNSLFCIMGDASDSTSQLVKIKVNKLIILDDQVTHYFDKIYFTICEENYKVFCDLFSHLSEGNTSFILKINCHDTVYYHHIKKKVSISKKFIESLPHDIICEVD